MSDLVTVGALAGVIGSLVGFVAAALCASAGRDTAYVEGLHHGRADMKRTMLDEIDDVRTTAQFREDRAYREGFADGTEIGFGEAVEHFGFVEVDYDVGPDLTTARYDSRYSSQLKLIETRDAIDKALANKIKVS